MSLRSAALLILAGVLHAASMGNPWNGEPSGWLQLIALCLFARQLFLPQSPRRAALAGWLFATAWLAGSFWWLFVAMHTYAGLAGPVAALAVIALAAALAIYFALASAIFVAYAPVNRWLGA